MMRFKRSLAASLLGLAGLPAFAGTTADNFTNPEIDAVLWASAESYRYVDNGRLYMGHWGFGGTASNTGTTVSQVSTNQRDLSPAKAMKVTITVEDADRIDGCAANPTPSTVRGRIIAAFFNTRVGGPVAGDMTGDVLAQLWVRRSSNTGDAPGMVRIGGGVPQCTNADCSTANTLAGVDLGTANVGDKVTLQIEWKPASQQFNFIRDGGTPVVAPYTVVSTGTPGRPFNNLSVRAEVANCMAGRVKAGLGVQFDNYGIVH